MLASNAAPLALVVRTNVDFQLEIAPADGIRLPFYWEGDFGTSPIFGQHLVKLIRSTVRQRTILVAWRPVNSRLATRCVEVARRRAFSVLLFAAREAGCGPTRQPRATGATAAYFGTSVAELIRPAAKAATVLM
jgi:hypothetical protein